MSARAVQLPKDSGRWFVSVHDKGERLVRKAASEKEAVRISAEINATIKAEKAGILRGGFSLKVKKDQITFDVFSKRWVEGHVTVNLKSNTVRYYAGMIQRIPAYLRSRPLEEITREDLRKLTARMIANGLSRSTAGGVLRTVSAIFNAASEDAAYTGANPALKPGKLLREAKEPKVVDCLTRPETKHFLETAKDHFGVLYPLLFTALRTAARQGEIVGLAWDAIDWHGGFLTIKQTAANGEISSPKNEKARKVPLTTQLIELLKDHRRRAGEAALAAGKPMSPWVFPGPTGGLMDPSRLRKEFARALKKAGLRHVTFHSLRHTCLTMMAEAGIAMPVLQAIAGHSSITVTARYYLHVKTENYRGAVEVLDTPVSISRSAKTAKEARMEEEEEYPGAVQILEFAGSGGR